jgi:hypothetical protein
MSNSNFNKRKDYPHEEPHSAKRLKTFSVRGTSNPPTGYAKGFTIEPNKHNFIDLTADDFGVDRDNRHANVFESLAIPLISVPSQLEAMLQQMVNFQSAYTVCLERVSFMLEGLNDDLIEQHHCIGLLRRMNKDLQAKLLALSKAHSNLCCNVEAVEQERKTEQSQLLKGLKDETIMIMDETAKLKAKVAKPEGHEVYEEALLEVQEEVNTSEEP